MGRSLVAACAMTYLLASSHGPFKSSRVVADGHISARAALIDSTGRSVGDAALRQTPHGVLLQVNLKHIKAGVHGFHIHEIGRCNIPRFDSSGSHFAPNGREHGWRNFKGPHAGGLPNVHVSVNETVSLDLFLHQVTLDSGPGSLLDGDGSALVLHAGADDYLTDHAGNAGERIACGVIVRGEE